MTELAIETTDDGVVIAVKVVPGGSRDAIAGLLGDALKLKVAAPAEGGKANQAVCKLLARTLGRPVRDVRIVAGHSRPRKRIAITGLDAAALRRALSRT